MPNAQATRPQRCASQEGSCLAVQRPVRAVTRSRPLAFRAQRQWTVLRSATEEQGVCSLWLVYFLVGHRGWFTTSQALLKPAIAALDKHTRVCLCKRAVSVDTAAEPEPTPAPVESEPVDESFVPVCKPEDLPKGTHPFAVSAWYLLAFLLGVQGISSP